jgi:hypothetical protein
MVIINRCRLDPAEREGLESLSFLPNSQALSTGQTLSNVASSSNPSASASRALDAEIGNIPAETPDPAAFTDSVSSQMNSKLQSICCSPLIIIRLSSARFFGKAS